MRAELRRKLKDGKFQGTTEITSQIMSSIRAKGNRTTEVAFRMALVRRGIKGWSLHPKTVSGRPDIYFAEERLAVFLDGCFWHGCRRCGHVPERNNAFWRHKFKLNMERDVKKTNQLRGAGISVLRLWEHELKLDLDLCLAKLLIRLEKRRQIRA
ncbi:MAG: very short patch repair endonuclease [Candidatus Hydrogenedentes bacterium]|nr:very short patch repair endonuclease [Candidatus Hydrogenedentota bacterium]